MILSQMSNLQQRLIVSSVAIFLLIISVSFSHHPFFAPLFVLLASSAISVALWEFYGIAQAKGYQPLVKMGVIGTLFFGLAVYSYMRWDLGKMLPEIVLGLILMSVFTYYLAKGADPFINLAVTLFGILYLTIPLSSLIGINYFYLPPFVNDGRWCLIYLLAVTKMTDASAFFVGKKWGKRKLSPYISPKKTLEGSLGGIFGAVFASLVLYTLFQTLFDIPPFDLSLTQNVWLAILISVAAQFGDLAESLLKRDVGMKDSSHLPGLGGMLDMVDSLVFTAPLMYIFLQIQGQLL
jgi:phosphatidate cytidylyltransferase